MFSGGGEEMEVGRWKSIGEEEGWGRVEFFNIYCGAHILIINLSIVPRDSTVISQVSGTFLILSVLQGTCI